MGIGNVKNIVLFLFNCLHIFRYEFDRRRAHRLGWKHPSQILAMVEQWSIGGDYRPGKRHFENNFLKSIIYRKKTPSSDCAAAWPANLEYGDEGARRFHGVQQVEGRPARSGRDDQHEASPSVLSCGPNVSQTTAELILRA